MRDLSSSGEKWARPPIISVITKIEGLQYVSDLLAESILDVPHWPDTSTRLASIHLSSGTTGKSKGVKLTHHNYVANCYQLAAHDPKQFHPASRTVSFTPWAHIAMTTMPLFLGPWTGMMHHAMPSFNIDEFGKLVGSNQATSF
jgi:long-subunit acyl-CoA synthetase (AMP-forming)